MNIRTIIILTMIGTIIQLFSWNFTNARTLSTPQDIAPDIINNIRQNFYAAIEDGEIIDKITDYIERTYSKETETFPAVILAYYGGIETLKAKHSYNPINKFRYVISGMKMLNRAVEKSPFNIEVRFLRFAVLHNIPGVFGITKERESDLLAVYSSLLKKDYSSIDEILQKGIAEFLIESDRLNSEQVNRLRMLFPGIKER